MHCVAEEEIFGLVSSVMIAATIPVGSYTTHAITAPLHRSPFCEVAFPRLLREGVFS